MTTTNHAYLAARLALIAEALGYPPLVVPVGGDRSALVESGEASWRELLHAIGPDALLALRNHLERTYGVLV